MHPLLTAQQLAGRIPDSDWLRFGILLLALLSLLQVIRLVSHVNRTVLCVVFLVGGLGLFFSWVHNRNEPSFLTPVVNVVEPWFPKRLRSFDT